MEGRCSVLWGPGRAAGEGGVRGLAPEGEGEGCVSCSRRRRVFEKMYSASSCSSSRQSYNKCRPTTVVLQCVV